MIPSNPLPSKPRYEILDGLRGVAAAIVLLYHHFEVNGLGLTSSPINHGYLAVDFFFILSGYVVGYAYDDRWGRMSLAAFFKRRLTRLHPMIVLSTVTGLLFFYFGTGDMFPLVGETPVGKLLLVALLGLLMIPVPVSMDVRGWAEVSPINGSGWTLYFEYFANIIYALFIRRFPRWLLALFVAASAFLTLNVALGWDVFGTLGERPGTAYTMVGGWALTAPELTIGFTRLLFPFFAGLLLSRLGWKIRVRGGFLWCSLLLVVLLAMPRVGGEAHGLWNGMYEAACILLFFPVVVLMGGGERHHGPHGQSLQVPRRHILSALHHAVSHSVHPVGRLDKQYARRNIRAGAVHEHYELPVLLCRSLREPQALRRTRAPLAHRSLVAPQTG